MLNYETHFLSEEADWVVFLHGAGGSIKTWKYQVDYFSEHFNLLLLDLRDHGDSKNISPHAKDYSFGLITTDIYEVIDFLKIEKAHFVTLSFGSVLMQDFTARFPEKVQSIVFSGAIFKGNLAIRTFVHLAKFFNYFLPYSTMYTVFSYLLMPKKRNQLARRVYQRQAGKLSQSEYMKWVGLYDEFFRLLNQFYKSSFTVKSLVIMGEDDFVFLKAARSFAERHAKVAIDVLDDAGHICNIDQWELFNRKAVRFILNQ
ncbi:MAG: alpha/beta hydrolase [Cyclobacteriaceae bacterium]